MRGTGVPAHAPLARARRGTRIRPVPRATLACLLATVAASRRDSGPGLDDPSTPRVHQLLVTSRMAGSGKSRGREHAGRGQVTARHVTLCIIPYSNAHGNPGAPPRSGDSRQPSHAFRRGPGPTKEPLPSGPEFCRAGLGPVGLPPTYGYRACAASRSRLTRGYRQQAGSKSEGYCSPSWRSGIIPDKCGRTATWLPLPWAGSPDMVNPRGRVGGIDAIFTCRTYCGLASIRAKCSRGHGNDIRARATRGRLPGLTSAEPGPDRARGDPQVH